MVDKSTNEAELRKKIIYIFGELVAEVTDGRSKYEDFQRSPESEESAGRLENQAVDLFAQERNRLLEEVLGVSENLNVANPTTPITYEAVKAIRVENINQLIKEQK